LGSGGGRLRKKAATEKTASHVKPLMVPTTTSFTVAHGLHPVIEYERPADADEFLSIF
jgi:hypothetical protein